MNCVRARRKQPEIQIDETIGYLNKSATAESCSLPPWPGDLGRRYPKLELDMHLSDAMSNMVDESIDVAIRIDATESQPNLIARRLTGYERIICASKAYLETRGTPQVPADLLSHNCLQFAYGGSKRSWRLQAGQDAEEIQVRGTITINNSEVLRRAILDDAGIAMLPDWLVRNDLRSGALTRVLENYQANPGAMDIGLYAMYQANRRGSLKVKAFIDMLEEQLDACLKEEFRERAR
jgi:DNA-binding transcriptional LysR family regulator